MRKPLKRCWKCPGREVRLRALSKIALIPVKWLPSPHLIKKRTYFQLFNWWHEYSQPSSSLKLSASCILLKGLIKCTVQDLPASPASEFAQVMFSWVRDHVRRKEAGTRLISLSWFIYVCLLYVHRYMSHVQRVCSNEGPDKQIRFLLRQECGVGRW